jgi:hypothetical protein
MVQREPVEVTNLDGYGSPALEWSRARQCLAEGTGPEVAYFLGTTGPDRRPHAAGIGAVWEDGDLYLVSGAGTRKSRNLAANPACTVSARLAGMDVVLSGEASRVVDRPTLDRIAARYRELGWPAEVAGDAFTAPYSAPSAGPPPWQLYRVTVQVVVGLATAEPHGATRWRFAAG